MDKMTGSFAPIVVAACLSACVSVPVAQTVMALPGPHKSPDLFMADQAACQQYAGGQASHAVEAANNQAVGNALLTAALGAGVGAAFGSIGHAAGTGAAIGAGSGVAAAGLGTAYAAPGTQAGAQQQFDMFFAQCMMVRGNTIPAMGPPPTGYAAGYR